MYCSNCRKHVVVNAKSQDPSTFLKNHQSQCTATSPRKRVVAEEPVGLEEFEARLDASRARGLKSSAQTSRQSRKC